MNKTIGNHLATGDLGTTKDAIASLGVTIRQLYRLLENRPELEPARWAGGWRLFTFDEIEAIRTAIRESADCVDRRKRIRLAITKV